MAGALIGACMGFLWYNAYPAQVFMGDSGSLPLGGVLAWMALVAIPSGRYYWSEYEPLIGNDSAESQTNSNRHRRRAPGSADDTFEIVAGVVNYIGDWKMRTVSSQRNRLDPVIAYGNQTLQQYVTQYPEHSVKFETYLSLMGKEAISLAELAKIVEEQPGSP